MVEDGIAEYANPASINRAAVMMLRHIGFTDQAAALEKVLDEAQDALSLPGDGTGNNTAKDFTEFVLQRI